eukprot:s149_g9.t1
MGGLGHCSLSKDNVMDLDRRQMLTRLSVSYVGEKGVDAGGLTRDFFSSFSSTLVDDPQMKAEPVIWKKTGRGSLHPMPYPVPQTTYGRQPNRMYQVCGRVFAMAMLHGCKMGCPLSKFTLDGFRLLGDRIGNKEFLEKSLEELGLAGTLTFTGSTGCELIPGGASIQVTDENKEDWLRRVLKWELFSSAEHAASWFRAGLVDVLGGHREMKSARCPLLCLFDADTLIELWGKSGVTRSQVAIWRAVSDISRRVEQQAAWFFQVLEQDFDDELRGKVLQFTTGSSSMGREGLQIFRIDVAEGRRLPSAMTCGNLLQLPRYSSKVVLRRQLQTAVETTGSFEMLLRARLGRAKWTLWFKVGPAPDAWYKRQLRRFKQLLTGGRAGAEQDRPLLQDWPTGQELGSDEEQPKREACMQ